MTHKGPVDAPRSISHLAVVPKLDVETLQQQWMALLVMHHLICHDERVPEIRDLLEFWMMKPGVMAPCDPYGAGRCPQKPLTLGYGTQVRF